MSDTEMHVPKGFLGQRVEQLERELTQAKARIIELESQANFAATNATKLVDKCAAGKALAEALREKADQTPFIGDYAGTDTSNGRALAALAQWEKLNKP